MNETLEHQAVRPLQGKLFARFDNKYKDNEGGIIVPDAHQHAGYTATVLVASRDAVLLAYGMTTKHLAKLPDDTKDRIAMEFGTLDGKRVILSEYAGESFRFDGVEVYICEGSAVRAILEDVGDAKVSEPDAQRRCRFCGPAKPEIGKGSMFLEATADPHERGVTACPVCGRRQ